MKQPLIRSRSDFLLESLALYERESAVNRAILASKTATLSEKKRAFTRYSGALMTIRRLQRELEIDLRVRQFMNENEFSG